MRRLRSAAWNASVGRCSVFVLLFFLPQLVLGQDAWEMRVCADPNRLPFSSRDGEGFDNRIAEILAEELNADVTYIWTPESFEVVRSDFLWWGECDLVFGLQDGAEGFLTSAAYYRSPYAFIYLHESPFEVHSLDDSALAELRIGIQAAGSTPHVALVRRGLAGNVVLLDASATYGERDHLGDIVNAVVTGGVDVGIAWGPIAGYFAQQQPVSVNVVPVTPEVDPPFLLMVHSITIGVRPGDESFRDRLNVALARRWDDIQMILEEYGVPLSPLPRPGVPDL